MEVKMTLNDEFKEYYVAKPIKQMLTLAKDKVMKKDWDRVYLIDGGEGSGKSLLALQLGYFLDRLLKLDNVVFTGKDFTKAIHDATKGQVIIFDEAFNGLSSSGAMSSMNRLIVKNLQECRQKNLFIIIVLPTFFMLQKYVAIFRSKALFHVYCNSAGDRGFVRVYNSLNKKFLYLNGHKFYSYKKPFVKANYRFNGKYPVTINEILYREKKLLSLKESESNERVPGQQWRCQRDALLYYLNKTINMKNTEIAVILKDIEFPMGMDGISKITREYAHKLPFGT